MTGHGKGQHPPRTDREDSLPVHRGMAVTTGAHGGHLHRIDMGEPFADQAALIIDDGTSLPDDGDIGGGAADINNQRLRRRGKGEAVPRGGGRSAGHGGGGLLEGVADLHGPCIAADDIDLAGHAEGGERLLHAVQKILHDRHQPGIEHGGRGPFLDAGPVADLMGEEDRLRINHPDGFGHDLLMGGIDDAHGGADGIGVHMGLAAQHRIHQSFHVQFFLLLAQVIVAAAQKGS